MAPRLYSVFVIICSLAFGHCESDPGPEADPFIREEHMVSMRDGIDLYTLVFVPVHVPVEKKPAVFIRTPYGTDGLEAEGKAWISQGYNAVMQDFRGRYQSKGTFDLWLNDSTDAYDTMQWIAKQSWSDGRVFVTGASANGIAAYLEPMTLPMQLHAQLVVVASAEMHKTIYQQGAYRQGLIDGWLDAIGESWWSPIARAQEPMSEFWEPDNMAGKFGNVIFPAVHLSGWYDIFNQQQLAAFDGYQKQSLPAVRGTSFLVVVPTGHCAGGQVAWPNGLDGVAVAEALTVALFKLLADAHLDAGADAKAVAQLLSTSALADVPALQWYVMGPGLPGTQGNYWTSGNDWPAFSEQPLFLAAGGALTSTPPDADASNTSFVYDPANPVPTLGGNNLILHPCGPWDQSSLEKRTDVITFTSAPLGAVLAVTGPLTAMLWVSSNATDTDITVKVTDVFPNGTSLLVQDGIIRMRWRDGPYTPSLLEPGNVYQVNVSVWNTSYIFNTGHSVRVDISSSNYPRFTANPNNGLPLAANGTLVVAQNTILHDAAHPSALILPSVSTSDLPPTDIMKHDVVARYCALRGRGCPSAFVGQQLAAAQKSAR
eukprot:TRINITY_DN3827_c1_g1_i1.p1 TRINITY_DN3827_c1_g1~~TRINITY_DN3827_c1_g1_i1.p1  ORF type:complete len:610 (-),score=204.90 TRINITY_DN3827_c1_g1_i1:97-1893(-)